MCLYEYDEEKQREFDREWCLLSVRCEKDLGVFVKVQGL